MDDNSVYRTLFFEETDDHLQQLNDNILELESNPDDMNLLNEIFRSAHTLKGMAATMGYDVMTELTHKMENIFELFKSGKLPVTSEAISLIFKCLDRLGGLVEDLREEKELQHSQIEDLLSALSQFETSGGASNENNEGNDVNNLSKKIEHNALTVSFEHLEEADISVIEQLDGEDKAYSVAVRLDKDCAMKGARVYLIMERIEGLGDLLHTEPSTEDLEDGNFDTDFQFIFISQASQEEIEENILGNSEIDSVVIKPFNQEADQMKSQEVILENATNKPVDNQENKLVATDETKPSETQKVTANTVHHNNNHKNQSIRVDLSRLDLFLNLVSELVVYRNQLEDVSNRAHLTEIKDSLEQVSRLTSELQELVLKIRMQQVNVVFSRFPRMVRDLSNELNKEMDLIIEGEETELDKTVVSELSEPLVHILRNSVDHGIEAPEVREQLGKSRRGKIHLIAYQEGNQVIITISDDGKGLNPEIIRESAARKGLSTTGLSDEEVQKLIFHPGFSTAKEITNISGRGVGMDAVQSKIHALGGTIELRSVVNEGTTFIIKLPLTLSIIEALMVRVGSETFAIPLDVVERVVLVHEDKIEKTFTNEVYEFQGQMIPIIRMNHLLSINDEMPKKHYAIIVSIDQKYYGILADELIGQQEIVIKKIDPILQQIKKYQGATILGDGSIALILDVNTICNEVRNEL
nr:chemotaxis protein CheA [Enterococcus cecorum]